MIQILVLLSCALVCYSQNIPVAPAAPVRCGVMPKSIYPCLGSPKLLPSEVSRKCNQHTASECERIKCVFKEAGWLKGYNLKMPKVIEYYDQYAKDHPEWATAVQSVKTLCLSQPLKAQGVYINCPAYDIVHCTLTTFLKNVPASKWSSDPECSYARQFATSCPICPEECFSTAIPIGSCNACYLLPVATTP